MEIKAIERALALCRDVKIEEAIKLLEYERRLEIMKSKNVKPNFLKSVKKFIEQKTYNEKLGYVQHDKNDDCQFICDGYTYIKFYSHREELDSLPNLAKEASIDMTFLQQKPYELQEIKISDTDKQVIKNIKKYIDLHKKGEEKVNGHKVIKLFDSYWDADFLKALFDIIGYDQEFVYKEKGRAYSGIHFYDSESESVILPIRLESIDYQENITNYYNEFVELLNNK